MALKAVLASLEGIPEAVRGEYKAGEGGKFFLDVVGLEAGAADTHPAVGELVRAKHAESTERTKLATALAALREEHTGLKTKFETLSTEFETKLKGGMSKEDVDRLEKSHNEKLARDVGAKEAEIKQLNNALVRVLVNNNAKTLAAKLAKDPRYIPVLESHIAPRLAVELDGETAKLRVLDGEGKPTALTLDDLGKEFLDNPAFDVLLIGSKASGGGAEAGHGGGGAPPAEADKKIASLDTSAHDLALALRSKRKR